MSSEERFERAIERLLADRSPRSEVAGLSEHEQRMVRMAQLLRGSRGGEMAPGESWSAALANLHGLRLGRCARRILLLASRPADEPSIIPAERDGRAAAESHRRAMRHLAAIGLVELTWKVETVETKGKTRTGSVLWDPDAGVYREVRPKHTPIERAIQRRAVRLTALGALLVDRLRPELETGKRIRWDSIVDLKSR